MSFRVLEILRDGCHGIDSMESRLSDDSVVACSLLVEVCAVQDGDVPRSSFLV